MSWEFKLVAGPYGSPLDGPCWDGKGLLFTQVMMPAAARENRILRYDPATGETTDFRYYTHRVMGLALSSTGTLYGCQSTSRRVIRFDADGSAWAMAHKISGEYHNEPRDLIVDSKQRIWFSDPYAPLPGTRPQFASRVTVRIHSADRSAGEPRLASPAHDLRHECPVRADAVQR